MPNTFVACTDTANQFKAKDKKTHACNFFGQVFRNPNRRELLQLVKRSLHSLQVSFFDGNTCEELQELYATSESCSSHDLLILFLLLLNVDRNLKHTVLCFEVEAHAVKLERFLTDLKEDLVVQFFIDDNWSKQFFISACEECWVLA